MELIESVTVGSGGASSIEFTSIPQDGTDLVLVMSARTTKTTRDNNRMTFNNTTTGYSERLLFGSGSSVSSVTAASTSIQYTFANGTNTTANTFGNDSIYISNYTSATNKSVSIDAALENNDTTSNFLSIDAATWANTAAITSIKFTPENSYVEHSTASLYKITSGSDGITSVS